MKLWKFLRTYMGAAILIGAIAYAAVRVGYNQMTYEAPGVTTISICHWQLESGFREALQVLIAEYENSYAEEHDDKIRILQAPVSERGYRQYVNTGLIGGTAPDIIEKGMAKTAGDPAYVARFFLPLGDYLDEANPYNRGTPLEGLPWRDTFFDGLQGAYDRTLLDYYYVPFSMFTTRVFYNVELYQEVTGREKPPESYEEFLAVCKEIREHAEKSGRRLVPIAGSKYQGSVFRRMYEVPFLFDLVRQTDDNHDGVADRFETYLAFKKGIWQFDSPRFVQSWNCMLEIASNFQNGWLAALRDDAVFLFVQGNAIMTASGSWDAPSIKKQVEEKFTVGVFDFPMPTDHKVYGQYVSGPASEASIRGGIPWAITRQSRHRELCIDFLRFCTTQAHNERFNRSITWLPVVRGARLSPDLEPFRPRIEGFVGHFAFDISTPVKLITEGNRWPLYTGRMTPEKFAAAAKEVYEQSADEGYGQELGRLKRNGRNLERILASLLTQQAFAPRENEARAAEKVNQILDSSQLFGHLAAMRQDQFDQLKRGEGE